MYITFRKGKSHIAVSHNGQEWPRCWLWSWPRGGEYRIEERPSRPVCAACVRLAQRPNMGFHLTPYVARRETQFDNTGRR